MYIYIYIYTNFSVLRFGAGRRLLGVWSASGRRGPGPKTPKKPENARKRSKTFEKARKSESAREFGARARNSLFSSSGGPFSAFSGLLPENRYFRAPETNFRAFRGSGQKFTIFELLRPIFSLFWARARNSLFSSS